MSNDIQTLREQVEQRELQLRLAEFDRREAADRHAARADRMRSWDRDRQMLESWGEIIDPMEYIQDDPNFGPYGRLLIPSALVSDRQNGRNVPFWRTEQELNIIRGAAKLVAMVSPAAIGAQRNLTNFVIGKGFQYNAMPVKGETLPTGLLDDIQRVINQFIKENQFTCGVDREAFVRAVRDGEMIAAMWHVGGGHSVIRFIEPEQLTMPRDPDQFQERLGLMDVPIDWMFGVATKADDVVQRIGYHVQWDATGEDCDFLDASRVVHVRRNVDANVKRGCSDFYAVQSHLEDAEKLLKNIRRTSAVLSAIAIIREHAAGVQQAQASRMVTNATEATTQRPTMFGFVTESITRYPPGATIDTPKGQVYKPSPIAAGFSESILQVEQAVLRMAGVRWCMPEYMISGDASNANFASTMVAESPFVRNAEVEQEVIANPFITILWRAIEIASNAGRFNKYGIDFETMYEIININATPPRVASRDTLKETQANMILTARGILSPESWSAREGLNREEELAKGAKPDPTPTAIPGANLPDAGEKAPGGGGGVQEAILEGDSGCGDGAGGFGSGNTCAKGGSGGGSATIPATKKPDVASGIAGGPSLNDAKYRQKLDTHVYPWFGAHAQEKFNALSDDEKKAVDHYQGAYFDVINESLRKGVITPGVLRTLSNSSAVPAEQFKQSKNLINAIDKAGAFPQPVTTYRGIGFGDDVDYNAFMERMERSYQNQVPYRARAFISSSISPKIANNFMWNLNNVEINDEGEVTDYAGNRTTPYVMMTIKAKKGLFANSGEHEVIQAPGTKFSVKNIVRGDLSTPTRIEVEEI